MQDLRIVRSGLLLVLYLGLWACAREGTPITAAEVREAGATTVAESQAVEKFLQKRFVEGVPLIEARALGNRAVPALVSLLDVVGREDDHKHVVTALGVVGGASARHALISYVENTSGEIRLDRFEALLNIPIALGRLASRGNTGALTYLLSHSEPDDWKTIGWKSGAAAGLEELYMARAVVNGLGISGRSEALEELLRIRDRDDRLQECVEENIILNRLVAKQGLEPIEQMLTSRRLECHHEGGAQSSNSDVLQGGVMMRSLSISHHADVGLNPNLLIERLDEANGILRCKNSDRDVACCLQLNVAEPVVTFGSAGDGDAVIQCERQLLRVLCLTDARVKLVSAISGNKLCETTGEGSFAGCAEEPGRNIVMEVSAFGDVWAHEYGHNRGLKHRDDSIFAIMHPTEPGPDEVNAYECQQLFGDDLDFGSCSALEACGRHP